MYILEMKIGAASISDNIVSEKIVLNQSMQVKNSIDSSEIISQQNPNDNGKL